MSETHHDPETPVTIEQARAVTGVEHARWDGAWATCAPVATGRTETIPLAERVRAAALAEPIAGGQGMVIPPPLRADATVTEGCAALGAAPTAASDAASAELTVAGER